MRFMIWDRIDFFSKDEQEILQCQFYWVQQPCHLALKKERTGDIKRSICLVTEMAFIFIDRLETNSIKFGHFLMSSFFCYPVENLNRDPV